MYPLAWPVTLSALPAFPIYNAEVVSTEHIHIIISVIPVVLSKLSTHLTIIAKAATWLVVKLVMETPVKYAQQVYL